MHHSKLFSDKSELYQAARPNYPDSIYAFLAQQCQATELVWDSACGNGQAAIGLAGYFDQVFASDVSQQQIQSAVQHANINYQVGPSEKSILNDQSADLVCVAQALHWFDFEKFWPEVDRVLKPNGVFATWGYNFPIWGDVLEPLIQTQILDIIAPYWAQHNKLLWNHYRDIDLPFTKLEAPKFSMTANWNLYQLFDLIHTFSATRRCMDEQGDEFFKNAFSDAHHLWTEELGDPRQSLTFELDFVFHASKKN